MIENQSAPVRAPKIKTVKSGIGGWLMFFMIMLVFSFIKVSRAYYKTYTTLEENAPWVLETPYATVFKLQCVTSLLVCAISFFLMIRYKLWSTIKTVVAAMWVTGPIAVIIDTAASRFWLPELNASFAEEIAPFLLVLITTSAWSFYLLRSDRVRNTYRYASCNAI